MAGSAFNAFAPFGAFRFSSRQTYGERIYRQLIAQQQSQSSDGAFDSSWNSYQSCRLYTMAMALQSAKLQLQHAANQRDPRYVTEKLEELEKDYQLIPLPTETIAQRRLALQAAMSRREGNTSSAIYNGLFAILGGGFSVVVQQDDATLVGQTTLKSFDNFRPGSGYKLVKTGAVGILAPIANPGTHTVVISNCGGNGEVLQPGEKLVVDVNCNGRTEVITVTAATSNSLTATFANAHDSGAICTTQQWPAWIGNKRHYIIMVSDASVLSNASLLTKINNFMDYATRGSSTWTVTDDTGVGSRAFTIGTSRIGQNTIGAIAD